MPRAGVTPNGVIASAVALADAAGLDTMTLGAVARSLGVSVPSLYKHVDSLADVRRSIGLRAARSLREKLATSAVGKSGRDALGAMAMSYREWASTHPGQYQAIQSAPDPEDAEMLLAAGDVVATISAVLSGYHLSEDATIDAIRFVRSVLHGFVGLVQAGGFKLDRDVEASFAAMIDGLHLTFVSWG